uniref:Uncharacterized protein n=1 Tax=Cryptomonas curvata TaxID=233186 RepID=A0A7S0MMR5_9CRYP|mmetsp:Transcript_48826/g.101937  ORF Transcript_48826/g.101937 Transcript_48826/m.101937 type:complete len:319 (+) Transcript_48826:44-1000(+)
MILFASIYSNISSIFPKNKKNAQLSVIRFVSNINCSVTTEKFPYIFSPKEKNQNRLYINSSVETTISELQNNRENFSFFLFCNINREHINYSLLYRLTSLKLRAEADEKIQNQAQLIDDFRNKILENVLLTDQPVSHAFILAEKRLKDIVNNQNITKETIINSFGETSIEVSCIWIVLSSALTAWENKKYYENNLVNSEIYLKMKMINQILSENKLHQSLLPVEIKLIALNLNEYDEKSIENKCYIDCIEGLMLIICQLEKMPSSSYSIFLEKVKNITKKIFFKNFGKEIENFQYIDINFSPLKIASLSKLIEVKQLK